MNRYQKILLIVACVNVAVVMLFPPFDSVPLVRGTGRSFDGFFNVFSYYDNRIINKTLLHMEIYLILTNMLIAWLLLTESKGAIPNPNSQRARRNGIAALVAGNIVIMLLFPPFETYASLVRVQVPSFDSFYFVFGDKFHRNFFIPILYMEVSFVLINGALFSLLYRESDRAQRDLAPEQVAALAKGLSPENARKLARELQQQVLIESLKKPRPLEDPSDRRKRPRDSKLDI